MRRYSGTCNLFFSTLSNPTRLAIVELLRDGSKNVTEISEALKQDQTTISHNLRPLVRCRLIFSERGWREKLYSINQQTMGPLFDLITNHAREYCPRKGNCQEKR